MSSVQSVSVLGQEFRPGVCVCIQAPCDEDYPKFAQVVHVLLVEELKMLLLRTFTTDFYSHHHNAYCVTKTSDHIIVEIHELALHDVFSIYMLASTSYIVIRSCCHSDVFI